MSAFDNTATKLGELALVHDAVLAMFSGGKDSLVTMDLCVRTFRRVVGVHMYFVPGLATVEATLDGARQRWGVELLMVPHWRLARFLRAGIYCFRQPGVADFSLPDVYALAREQTGIQLVASGGKRCDGMWRRRMMKAGKDEDLVYPIAEWSKFDVLAYLSRQGIEPPGEKFDTNLAAGTVLDWYDNHREDYERVKEVFPHVEAIVRRREWYGVSSGKRRV